jgi:hypothetical protein
MEEIVGLKQILLSLLLAVFTAETGYVLYLYGMGWIEVVFSNPVSTLVFVDLCIALTMVMVWMVGDARERGISPWPYIATTLFAGSVGTLAYLIRRDWKREVARDVLRSPA